MQTVKAIVRSCLFTGVAVTFFATSQAQAASAWVLTYHSRKLNNTTLISEIVTQDGTDQAYRLRQAPGGAVTFSTPEGNVGGNTREFFWPANAQDSMDQMSCSVWTHQTGEGAITQQGAVLRVHKGENGGTRGITAMKNIWMGATWIFNVHVWDTANTAAQYTGLAGFDMSEVVGKMWWQENADGTKTLQSNMKPLPWHFCARTVGDKLQFKVWTNEQEKQPSWKDPKFVREVQIPAEWNKPGKAGWYIGHLKPGHAATFNILRTFQR